MRYFKTTLVLLVALCGYQAVCAQQLRGQWKKWVQQEVRLEGFDGLTTYPIASTTTDAEGRFSLAYSKADYGVGCLLAKDQPPLFVILSGENIALVGDTPGAKQSTKVLQGRENLAFEQYALQQPKREQALSAWVYLEKLYQTDSLFLSQSAPLKAIATEKLRLKQQDDGYVATLPKDSYVRWFLPMRKLVSNVSIIAQYRTEEIPATLQALRAIDYSDTKLYKSGLYKDAIDNHVWFIENSSGPLDSVFADINRSIDLMLPPLAKNEKLYNTFTSYLFDLLESRSLFGSSEYLALKVLADQSCHLNTDLTNKLESYRKLKKGNTAPDIALDASALFPQSERVALMSEIKSPYKLVVFAASWCDHCQQVLPKIATLYPKWKAKGIEVVYVSLDETAQEFQTFAKGFPFVSTCDYKKWSGKAVTEYHVSGTPTYYLLNAAREIVLKPISVEQIDAWVDYSIQTP